jgi:hypothetical protein
MTVSQCPVPDVASSSESCGLMKMRIYASAKIERRDEMTIENAKEAKSLVGRIVYTSDGANLGTIQEVRGEQFKMKVALHPDYWLNLANLDADAKSQTSVAFTREELDGHKVSAPSA